MPVVSLTHKIHGASRVSPTVANLMNIKSYLLNYKSASFSFVATKQGESTPYFDE